MSFGGQKYDDSPAALYEQMKEDPFFREYEFLWGFVSPDKHKNVECKKIKVDTVGFYIAALSSAVWITNSSIERGLNMKRRAILEYNSWHGTPLKKMGNDIENGRNLLPVRRRGNTIFCAQSEYDREIFARLFAVSKQDILLSDLPRNDNLLKYSETSKAKIRASLGIPDDKRIILYAPTFREYDRNGANSCYLNPPISIEKWRKKLSAEYVVLFRAHYEIIDVLGIKDGDFMKNVSGYHRLNDLIAVSDILISDYSSIYFDYSITGKPMLNFSYDYETYLANRGLYLDLKDALPCNINYTEDTLLDEIVSLDIERYRSATDAFRKRFAPFAGNACNVVIDKIKNDITKKNETEINI